MALFSFFRWAGIGHGAAENITGLFNEPNKLVLEYSRWSFSVFMSVAGSVAYQLPKRFFAVEQKQKELKEEGEHDALAVVNTLDLLGFALKVKNNAAVMGSEVAGFLAWSCMRVLCFRRHKRPNGQATQLLEVDAPEEKGCWGRFRWFFSKSPAKCLPREVVSDSFAKSGPPV
jgi:hypothetical protein